MDFAGLSEEGLGSAVDGAGLPDIMDAHRASTSTVAALVSARGFFSIFLETCISKEAYKHCTTKHTLERAYSSS